MRSSSVSVRSYDRDDVCIYDLAQAVEGLAVDPARERAVSDPRTKFLYVHTAKPGCLLCRVERT